MNRQTADDDAFVVRPYRPSDRDAARRFDAEDEFARPRLIEKHPRMGDYCADGLAHYRDLEPESCFVAEADGQFIGSLLGAIDAAVAEQREETYTRRLRRRRLMLGRYGIPTWLIPIIKTESAPLLSEPPHVDPRKYPAELHIGVKRDWRRKGVGTALMNAFEGYLQERGVPGYHLYASGYHHQGVAFYRKYGLTELGEFKRRFHDGFNWLAVAEYVFVRALADVSGWELESTREPERRSARDSARSEPIDDTP